MENHNKEPLRVRYEADGWQETHESLETFLTEHPQFAGFMLDLMLQLGMDEVSYKHHNSKATITVLWQDRSQPVRTRCYQFQFGDDQHILESVAAGVQRPVQIRAVDHQHALNRLGRRFEAVNPSQVTAFEVPDNTNFDAQVDWVQAELETALNLGIISDPSEANKLGYSVDPPAVAEVLEHVLEHPLTYEVVF